MRLVGLRDKWNKTNKVINERCPKSTIKPELHIHYQTAMKRVNRALDLFGDGPISFNGDNSDNNAGAGVDDPKTTTILNRQTQDTKSTANHDHVVATSVDTSTASVASSTATASSEAASVPPKTSFDLNSWLQNIQMDEYSNLLVDEGLNDLSLLKTITEEDLRKLGITKLGHRRKLSLAIKSLP